MDESTINDVNMDISKLKVPDLKRELKSRGLSCTGNKTDLMERLQAAVAISKRQQAAVVEVDVDDLDDDLLNDDDLDHENLDASESVLNELDEQLEAAKAPKRKLSETKLSRVSDSKPAKKVVLNRETSITNEYLQNKGLEDRMDASNGDKKDETSSKKKVIKLSEVSAKERLEMRAKKFGQPVSVEAKKVARAHRFASGGSPTSASSIISSDDKASLDALKKRAERFGASVSPVMSNMVLQERLERRKQRFGNVAASNGSTSQSEKAKQRLERFKTPIK